MFNIDIGQAIVNNGIPALMLYMLAMWMGKRIDKDKKEAVDREQRMARRIDQLESKIEVDLSELVRRQGDVLDENSKMLEKCTMAIEQCTSYMRSQNMMHR